MVVSFQTALQSALAQAPSPSVQKPKVSYEDSESGFRQLANDVLKAQKENNPAHAQEILDSLVLPNFRDWYASNFTEVAAEKVVPAYAANGPSLPAQLAGAFLSAQAEGFKNVEVVRYVDDRDACLKAGSKVFGGLTARKARVPLYELRFSHGDRYKSVFAFAYIDGAFRVVLVPDFEKSGATASAEKPLPKGGTVQAAQLVCRVQPPYPEDARMQRISGTVRLHAIIGRDGSIKQLEVLSGPPALVTTSMQAVRLWRYRPTLFNGEPVEVDTTIDVIYALNN